MVTTYTKLKDGSWGLRAQGSLKAGQRVSVTKKDGTSRTETVGKVLWSGNGVTLATIQQTGGGSGSDKRPVCAECGRPGYLVSDLEDGLWKHRNCCDIPPE